MRALLSLTCALLVSGCQPTAAPNPQNLDQAMRRLEAPIGHLDKASQTTVTTTSISLGITTATPEPTPPYRLEATIRFDGEHLQIKATTDLPDGTLYRLGVQREIAVTPSLTSTLTSMMTHAGGFIPHDKVTLPEDGLPTSLDSFIAEAGRITGGELIALVQMFPRYVQLLGADDEPDRYTPNTEEVQVTFAVERGLPGQVKGLSWPEGTDRFTWRQTVPCALPDKAKAP